MDILGTGCQPPYACFLKNLYTVHFFGPRPEKKSMSYDDYEK